jgi:hypothetical protein
MTSPSFLFLNESYETGVLNMTSLSFYFLAEARIDR